MVRVRIRVTARVRIMVRVRVCNGKDLINGMGWVTIRSSTNHCPPNLDHFPPKYDHSPPKTDHFSNPLVSSNKSPCDVR